MDESKNDREWSAMKILKIVDSDDNEVLGYIQVPFSVQVDEIHVGLKDMDLSVEEISDVLLGEANTISEVIEMIKSWFG